MTWATRQRGDVMPYPPIDPDALPYPVIASDSALNWQVRWDGNEDDKDILAEAWMMPIPRVGDELVIGAESGDLEVVVKRRRWYMHKGYGLHVTVFVVQASDSLCICSTHGKPECPVHWGDK